MIVYGSSEHWGTIIDIRRWGLPYSIQSHELFFLHELFPYYLFIPLVFVTIDKAVGKVILDNCGDLREPTTSYNGYVCEHWEYYASFCLIPAIFPPNMSRHI